MPIRVLQRVLRLKTRTSLILVAIVAFGMWGEQMRRRRAYCLRMSREHRGKLLMGSLHYSHPLMSAKDEERLRRTYPHAAWHLKVSDTYLYHADRPWPPIPSEPKEPFDFPPGQADP